MPQQAGTARLLRRVRAWFWVVALLCASADLLSKPYVFALFPRRFPGAAQRIELARQAKPAVLAELARRAALAGPPRLARLAQEAAQARPDHEERLIELLRQAELAGHVELAGLAREAMLPSYSPIIIVRGFLHIVRGKNYGGVFGMAQDAGVLWTIFGVAAGALVVWFAYRKDTAALLVQIALGLLLAGAIGNLFDRITFGYVRDFIQVYYWPGKDWPAFNVADAAICVGAAYLAVYAFFFAPKETQKNKKS